MKVKEETVIPEETQVTETDTAEQAVAITEASAETDAVAEENETPPTDATEQVQEKVFLSVEKVAEMLASSRLPKPAVERLALRQYETEEEVKETVAAEIVYLEAATGAGKPVGLGETSKSHSIFDPAKVAEAADRVNAKYFGK